MYNESMNEHIINTMIAENAKKAAAARKREAEYLKLNCPTVAAKHATKARSFEIVIEHLRAKLA